MASRKKKTLQTRVEPWVYTAIQAEAKRKLTSEYKVLELIISQHYRKAAIDEF